MEMTKEIKLSKSQLKSISTQFNKYKKELVEDRNMKKAEKDLLKEQNKQTKLLLQFKERLTIPSRASMVNEISEDILNCNFDEEDKELDYNCDTSLCYHHDRKLYDIIKKIGQDYQSDLAKV